MYKVYIKVNLKPNKFIVQSSYEYTDTESQDNAKHGWHTTDQQFSKEKDENRKKKLTHAHELTHCTYINSVLTLNFE